MNLAHKIATHDHDFEGDVLAQIQRSYPEIDAQEAFLVPTWFYRQSCWIDESVGSENALYNLPIPLRIRGALNAARLRECLLEVQRRHDVLRSVFRTLNGNVLQVIVPPRKLDIEVIDLTNLSPSSRDTQLASHMSEEAGRPFDLTTDVLLRGKLFRLADDEHVLQITTHHLVCDDWSSGILIQELFALYDYFTAGSSEPLPELTFHYGDFIRWRQRRTQDDGRRQAVWKAKLSGSKGFYHVRPDLPRPPIRTSRGATVNYTMPKQLESELRELARQQKVTVFMVLLAGFQSLLHLLSGDTDVAVGTCAANRPLPAVEKLIGRFANDLVVRTDYSGDPCYREILSRTRDAALDAYSYEDVAFGAVLEELVPDVDPSVTPLFQSIFILQNAPKVNSHAGTISAKRMLFDAQTAKYDLAVWVRMEDGVHITLEYNRDLFREETITGMTRDYEAVLAAMAANLESRVSESRSRLSIMQAEPARPTSILQDCTPTVFQKEIEAELITLWREVLGLHEISVTDDFFEVGGDSLRATQLLCRVEQKLGTQLVLGSLFSARTIREQAVAIVQRRSEAGPVEELSFRTENRSDTLNPSLFAGPAKIHKSVLRRATNRVLHLLCRFLPGATTVRPFLHRLRGISIGKEVWIGDDVYLENEFPECVEIHDGAIIGLRSTIIAHTNGAGRIIIGRNAFIGANTTVVTLGDRPLVVGEGAVLMASSLVSGNVAPYTLYGHDPARPLAAVTKAFISSMTYDDFLATLRPLSR